MHYVFNYTLCIGIVNLIFGDWILLYFREYFIFIIYLCTLFKYIAQNIVNIKKKWRDYGSIN